MGYSKTNHKQILAILSLMVATLIFVSSWEPLTYKRNSFLTETNKMNLASKRDELEVALEKASMANKTVIIAFVNKAYVEPNDAEYPTMFDLFLEGFWVGDDTRRLLSHLLVVSMDTTAHQRCLFRRLNCYRMAAEDDGLAGEKFFMSAGFLEMMWRRTSFLIQVLNKGYSFIFTDIDILWLRNPFTRLVTNADESMDLQISTDEFDDDASSTRIRINTGFYFIKSNNKTTSLFQRWYDTRTNSGGVKEQDVLQNLVRHGILAQLGIKIKFLNTIYFSGFCKFSLGDFRFVATVHATCCRGIPAKVLDLKDVLRNWKRFREAESFSVPTNTTNNFRGIVHGACSNSWIKKIS
ncbi:hypothetical protein AAHA92_23110 [Salvia divinorum]|uniref:Nucleotide-diphospho-sugar transferase domain-containing protein n=1 Tax=Salvia divinorum TaxID=28513 RepID=A0ABD1GRC9_SALDI